MPKTQVGGSQIGPLDLTTEVTGVLPIVNGGTGSTALALTGSLAPARAMDTGVETFTIAAGTVTQIAGTTFGGVTPAIGDRLLIHSAPAATGAATWWSTQPGNGLYVVTGNTTNLTVARATDMSGSVKPAGLTVAITGGDNAGFAFAVMDPNNSATAFTYGTTNIRLDPIGVPDGVTGSGAQVVANKTLTGPKLTADAAPTYAAGKMVFDTVNDCMTFFNSNSGLALQVGQEVWLRCRNVTGSTIPNGTPVYVTGSDSGLPSVAPAKGDTVITAAAVGMTTESIANNSTGTVTISGVVHSINTAAFTAGVAVYVDPTTAGALTVTPPAGAYFRCRVGFVVVSHATTGSIFVIPTDATPSAAIRTGVYQWELPNTISTLTASQPLSIRRLAEIPVSATRFKLHIRSYNQLTDVDATGTLTSVTAYIGLPAVDANGEYTGAFTATPTQIVTSTSITSGTEYISGWISPATFNLSAYKTVMVSVGFVVPTTGQAATGGGLVWYGFTASDAGVANPSLTRADNLGYLAMYIEYEFADDDVPIIMVVSNSTSGGGNGNAVYNRGDLDAWHQKWALSARGIAANLSCGGTWAGHFTAASPKWNYYSGLATPLIIDSVVMWNLASSDVSGGSSLATAKAAVIVATQKAKALWPAARVIHSSIMPRIENTPTTEAIRLLMNQWLETCPGGADQCWDLDSLVSNPVQIVDDGSGGTTVVVQDANYPARLHPNFDSGDGIHLRPRGHTATMTACVLRRST